MTAPVALSPSADGTAQERLPIAENQAIQHWLAVFVRQNWRRITAMLLLFGAALATGLVGPRLLGHLVESVKDGTTTLRVDIIALVFVAVLTTQSLLSRFARVQASLLGEKVLAETREGFVRHVVRLPLGTVESAGTGDLLSRATTDVERLNAGIRQAVPHMVMAAITLVLSAVAMLLTSPLLSLGLFLAVPFVCSTLWYRPRANRAIDRLLAQEADLLTSAHETVEGCATVEALGLAEQRRTHHGAALSDVVGSRRRITWLQSLWLPCLDLATVVPMAFTLLVGSLAYQRGAVGLAELTAMMLYFQGLASPLDDLLTFADELQVSRSALKRILGVQRLPAERADTAAEPGGGRGITLRDVHFGYVPEREVLHGISLDIEPGERLVIVGTSGAGKSTLGKLLAGVHRPTRGALTIGGTEISSLSTEVLRREVALVTQEHHVFAGTVRDNLTLPERPHGRQGAWSDEELWTALSTIGLAAWVRDLPDGLDTALGSGDTIVSPAAAQQLALARLVLADPHTLVLDEATAMMDSSTSRQTEQSLVALLRGRTVVSIVHQLDSVQEADRVVVMEGGRIVELGNHRELLTMHGPYAELWRAWSDAAR